MGCKAAIDADEYLETADREGATAGSEGEAAADD
jgi:thioredoxin reductase (NADPH)